MLRVWTKSAFISVFVFWTAILLTVFYSHTVYRENAFIKVEEENLKLKRKLAEEENSNSSVKQFDQQKKFIPHTKEHQNQWQVIHHAIRELFYTINSSSGVLKTSNQRQQALLREQMISLLADSLIFDESIDGANEWHKTVLSNIGTQIQEKLHRHQFPGNCSEARFLVCDLGKICGFGCQIHHAIYCLSTAVALGRTLMFQDDGEPWIYSKLGWKGVFEPITNCSFEKEVGKELEINIHSDIQELNSTVGRRAVYLPNVDSLSPKQIAPQTPLSIPASLIDTLTTHSTNPPAFIVSHFAQFLMRGNDQLNELLAKAEAAVKFEAGPIVGVHVRRTDKIYEAAYHNVSEYMEWTELWFRIQEEKLSREKGTTVSLKRRILLATDEQAVVIETKKEYENYEIVIMSNISVMDNGAPVFENQAFNVVRDVHLLSRCDYIVCTFSSQLGRLSYELMQGLAKHGDMGNRAFSLDSLYYFGGQLGNDWEAITDHKKSNDKEISLKRGDPIGISFEILWNGYSNGINRRTNETGLYPSHKVRQKFRVVEFSFFNDLNLTS